MNTTLFLITFSGICWTIVYIEAVRIGFKQKTYAIPFWALALNFGWELVCSVVGYKEIGINDQMVANIVWLVCDIFILITYFKYGKKDFPDWKTSFFNSWSVVGILISVVVQYLFILEFGLILGSSYSAFLQNLLMSVLFIELLYKRKNLEGQSLLIAFCKCLGTLAPTLLVGYIGTERIGGTNPFLLWIGILILAFDIAYIVMLFNKIKKLRKNIPIG